MNRITTNTTLALALLLLLPLRLVAADAQPGPGPGLGRYHSPVDFAVTMAGNVGEIRGERFHMGIDVKALQGVGSPIRAVDGGYVSRVGVSPTGYGQVVYVTHPGGEVSVYAHLDSFAPKIARWVRAEQYRLQSFPVDLYPEPEQFPVGRGEQIGAMGNTGSSGGPHLHLEIRNAQGHPRNIIAQGIYRVGDRVPPAVNRVLLFEVDTLNNVPVHRLKQSLAVTRNADGIYVSDSALCLSGAGYLAYETIDFKDGRSNTMGIYAIKQAVDGEVSMHWAIDHLTYPTSRYAATLVSYAQSRAAGRFTVLRTYRSPNNELPIYRHAKNRGILLPPPVGEQHRVETDIIDDAGNVSKIALRLMRDTATLAAPQPVTDGLTDWRAVRWTAGFRHVAAGLLVAMPQGALYESALLPFGYDSVRQAMRVGMEGVPLLRSIEVGIAAPQLPHALRSKALLVQVSTDDKGQEVISSRGGAWQQVGVQASVSSFGHFRVAVDTVAPVIRPVFKQGGELPAGRGLRFVVTDDLSGIVGYRLLVDGRWELLAYDPKNRRVEYIPQTRPRKLHTVELTVTDAKGNSRTFNAKYIW